jgi:hypothetical protein
MFITFQNVEGPHSCDKYSTGSLLSTRSTRLLVEGETAKHRGYTQINIGLPEPVSSSFTNYKKRVEKRVRFANVLHRSSCLGNLPEWQYISSVKQKSYLTSTA